MKTHIDLFRKKKILEPIPTAAQTLRSYIYLFLGLVVSGIAGAVLYYFSLLDTTSSLSLRVDQLNAQIRSTDAVQGNIVYFINKKEQLKNFLKNDSAFEDRYIQLQQLLADSQVPATVQQIAVALDKSTKFSVEVPDLDRSGRLFDYLESEQFLETFSELKMSPLTIPGPNAELPEAKDSLTLNFVGAFKNTSQN